jgi:ABC-2 type transport system permease protein
MANAYPGASWCGGKRKMKKIMQVFLNEIITIISRRSFILILFLVPLISFVVFFLVNTINRTEPGMDVTELINNSPRLVVEGYVDHSGLIKQLPRSTRDRLRSFASQAEAEAALEDREISAVYIVSEDFLESGRIRYLQPDVSFFSDTPQSGLIQYVLTYNLLEGDETLAERVHAPLNELDAAFLSPEPQRDPRNMMTFFLPYAVTFIFYITIFGSASLMLNSITDEKQNRVIEILMTSVTPVQMLAGKVSALGVIGLLQTLVWGGTGFALLRISGQMLDLPEAFQLPVSILLWGALFFVLGYVLYANLMAGVGALVPNLREASQATLLLVMPLILPLMLINLLVQQPNGGVAVALSLFPFTAPVAMMTRLATTSVPVWQPVVAAGLLIIAGLLVIRSVAGMFRAQTLLSGQNFSLKLLFKALAGKA